jgi:hypothetical protein
LRPFVSSRSACLVVRLRIRRLKVKEPHLRDHAAFVSLSFSDDG